MSHLFEERKGRELPASAPSLRWALRCHFSGLPLAAVVTSPVDMTARGPGILGSQLPLGLPTWPTAAQAPLAPELGRRPFLTPAACRTVGSPSWCLARPRQGDGGVTPSRARKGWQSESGSGFAAGLVLLGPRERPICAEGQGKCVCSLRLLPRPPQPPCRRESHRPKRTGNRFPRPLAISPFYTLLFQKRRDICNVWI